MYHFQTIRLVVVLLLTLVTIRIAKADFEDAMEYDTYADGDLIVVKPPVDPNHHFKFLPDLIVSDLARPVRQGSSYLVQVTVKNIGRAMAYPSYVLLRDNYANSGKLQLIGNLPSGQSQVVSILISGPEDQTNCYLSAIADYGNKVQESNETNNVKTYYGNW